MAQRGRPTNGVVEKATYSFATQPTSNRFSRLPMAIGNWQEKKAFNGWKSVVGICGWIGEHVESSYLLNGGQSRTPEAKERARAHSPKSSLGEDFGLDRFIVRDFQ